MKLVASHAQLGPLRGRGCPNTVLKIPKWQQEVDCTVEGARTQIVRDTVQLRRAKRAAAVRAELERHGVPAGAL